MVAWSSHGARTPSDEARSITAAQPLMVSTERHPTRRGDPVEFTSFESGPPDETEPRCPASGFELTVYFHTFKQVGNRLLADALMDQCAELGLPACVLFTGAQGFGDARRIRTETSEGAIPLIATATYAGSGVADPSIPLSQLSSGSLTTLQDVTLLDEDEDGSFLRSRTEAAELTVHCRVGADRNDPSGIAGVIELLRRNGVSRAIAVSGGDGVTAGERQRDRTFARSPDAPAMVVSLDSSLALAAALPALLASPHVDIVSATPIWIWKYRGHTTPTPIAEDAAGWRKLTVYRAEDALALRPRQTMLMGRLRKAGAAGVTVVRGRLGYSLGEPDRPRRGWFGRREAPLMTTIVDDRDQIARWFEIVDELTDDADLVTCESVRVLTDCK
jgi:PII-like signaling protein